MINGNEHFKKIDLIMTVIMLTKEDHQLFTLFSVGIMCIMYALMSYESCEKKSGQWLITIEILFFWVFLDEHNGVIPAGTREE